MNDLLSKLDVAREEWGQKVVIPVSDAVREYFEGPSAPRSNFDQRWYNPKDANFFDPVLISCILFAAIAFTILEPIIRRIYHNVITRFFYISYLSYKFTVIESCCNYKNAKGRSNKIFRINVAIYILFNVLVIFLFCYL